MTTAQATLIDEACVDCIGGIIGNTFVCSQVDADTLGAVLGELLADKFFEALSVDNRADQVVEFPAVAALLQLCGIRSGQAQAIRCGSHQSSFSPRFGGQMMYFIANKQFKSITIFSDQVACRMIGGNSERQDALLSAIIDADLSLEGVGEQAIPLVEQANCRHEHDGGGVDLADR